MSQPGSLSKSRVGSGEIAVNLGVAAAVFAPGTTADYCGPQITVRDSSLQCIFPG